MDEQMEQAQQGGEQEARQGEREERGFTQADIDRIIAREQAKWRRQQERAVETARTEAQRLAGMNAEERARTEREAREAELSRREAEITRRELHAQALDTLAGRGLPAELADVLNLSDAQSCEASIRKVESAFRASVQKGVEERLRGSAPKAPDAQSAAVTDKIRAAMGLGKP